MHTLPSAEYWDRLCRQCVIPLGKPSQVQREDVCLRQSLALAALAVGCSQVCRGSDKFEGSHLTYLNQHWLKRTKCLLAAPGSEGYRCFLPSGMPATIAEVIPSINVRGTISVRSCTVALGRPDTLWKRKKNVNNAANIARLCALIVGPFGEVMFLSVDWLKDMA